MLISELPRVVRNMANANKRRQNGINCKYDNLISAFDWHITPEGYELNRLCVDGEIKIPLSRFVSYCLNYLKSEKLIVISYADEQMHHFGTIYQATNFMYTGKTKSRTDRCLESGKHQRHFNENDSPEKVVLRVRSSKYRYIYFCCNKNTRKEYLRNLKYKIEPYPKGKSERYVLGEFIKPLIIPV